MKTAMMELIEAVNKHYSNPSRGDIFDTNPFLEKEKEQIIKDYHKGQMGIADLYKESLKKIGVYEEMLTDFEDAEEYYNQTYNQNKSFTYCQREIEGQSICDKQCEHCKEYYAPLENQNK